jgi:hypothetical protein
MIVVGTTMAVVVYYPGFEVVAGVYILSPIGSCGATHPKPISVEHAADKIDVAAAKSTPPQ